MIELGKILYDKYKDSDWMTSEYELKIDFDKNDRPFKIETDDDWTILAQWNEQNGKDIWGIWIIERPEGGSFQAEPHIDVKDLSPRK